MAVASTLWIAPAGLVGERRQGRCGEKTGSADSNHQFLHFPLHVGFAPRCDLRRPPQQAWRVHCRTEAAGGPIWGRSKE